MVCAAGLFPFPLGMVRAGRGSAESRVACDDDSSRIVPADVTIVPRDVTIVPGDVTFSYFFSFEHQVFQSFQNHESHESQ